MQDARASILRGLRTIVIGDSFVGAFTLLKKSSNVVVAKTMGGTIKGFTKDNSESSVELQNLIKKYRSIETACFSFGQVDIHFSYYYDLIVKNQHNSKDYYDKIAAAYIEKIASIKGIQRKIVFCVYPLPVVTDKIRTILVNYHIVTQEELDAFDSAELDKHVQPIVRINRLRAFNAALERECHKHNIEYASIYNELVDETDEIKHVFRDPCEYNVHIMWEPLIPIWCNYFDNFNIGISNDDCTDIRESGEKYVTEKSKKVEAWNQGLSSEDFEILNGIAPRKPKDPNIDQSLKPKFRLLGAIDEPPVRNSGRSNSGGGAFSGSRGSGRGGDNSFFNGASGGRDRDSSSGYNNASSGSRGDAFMSSRRGTSGGSAIPVTVLSAATSGDSAAPAPAKYVPPHLRNR